MQAEEPDLTPPPTPTGFAVSAAISHVFIEHDSPLYLQGHGHLRTRVYGKVVAPGDPLPVFVDAVEITQFTGTIHSHPSNPATTWRLWIKWESVDGVLSVSPAGRTNGLAVTTGQDVSKMVEAMTGAGKPFTVLTAPTVVGGVTFPAGIYATWAFIQEAQVTNAKIDTLDASKITAGFLSADRIDAGAISAAKIDSRGLSIKDAAGNILLAAGSPLAVGNVSGLGTLATANSIAYVDITGAKPPSDADKTSANTAAAIANQGAFATLSQITSANTSTYIADAAIGNAQIGGAIQSIDFSAGSAGWRIDKGGQAELNNGMFRGTVSAGTSPAVVGSSMTGSGAVLNPGGSFALGNASKNLSFDGSSLTMNGDLVVTGNIVNNAITQHAGVNLTAHSINTFGLGPADFNEEKVAMSIQISVPEGGAYQIVASLRCQHGRNSTVAVLSYFRLYVNSTVVNFLELYGGGSYGTGRENIVLAHTGADTPSSTVRARKALICKESLAKNLHYNAADLRV